MRLKSGSNQSKFRLSGGFVKPYAVIADPSASWGNRDARLRRLPDPHFAGARSAFGAKSPRVWPDHRSSATRPNRSIDFPDIGTSRAVPVTPAVARDSQELIAVLCVAPTVSPPETCHRGDPTLQPSSLVREAYRRLVRQRAADSPAKFPSSPVRLG